LEDKLDTTITFLNDKLKEFASFMALAALFLKIDPRKHPRFEEMRSDWRDHMVQMMGGLIKTLDAERRVEGIALGLRDHPGYEEAVSASRASSARAGLSRKDEFRLLWRDGERTVNEWLQQTQ
jgi:hypothetical protein